MRPSAAIAAGRRAGVTALAGEASLAGGTSLAGAWDAERPLMGGRVSVHLRIGPSGPRDARSNGGSDDAGALAGRMLDRIAAWSSALSRFVADSALVRLNASPSPVVRVGPTLTAVLDWAREIEGRTDGLLDVAMLDARLAAELGLPVERPGAAARRWSLRRLPRGALVERPPGLRFDLDGVAKGLLADRALRLAGPRSAVVDADGDIAIRVAPGDGWTVGVADPRSRHALLAALRLTGDATGRSLGLATSGTSVHRWAVAGGQAHHLIDPATWRPAGTDVVQATVLADTAGLAEAFAKAAVIAGGAAAFELAGRRGVLGMLLLTEDGEVRASEGMLRWLA